MISVDAIRALALSFPEVTEEPHFDKTSSRVKKKIFLTYDVVQKTACLKLSEMDQSVFSLADKNSIYPLPNKWGKQGWTVIEMSGVPEDLFADALTISYCEVAPKKLAGQVRSKPTK